MSSQPPSLSEAGLAGIGPGQTFRDSVRQIISDFLIDPLSLPDQFKAWLPNYLETNPPTLPISQITGFSQFTIQSVSAVSAQESTGSASYTDLATVGPTLSNVPDGNYVILFGALMVTSLATSPALMAVQVNSTSPVDIDAVSSASSAGSVSLMRAVVKPLSGGTNTLAAKYKCNGSTAFFANRWIMALKYSNL